MRVLMQPSLQHIAPIGWLHGVFSALGSVHVNYRPTSSPARKCLVSLIEESWQRSSWTRCYIPVVACISYYI